MEDDTGVSDPLEASCIVPERHTADQAKVTEMQLHAQNIM